MSAACLKVKMWHGCYVNVTQKRCSETQKFREGLFESEVVFMSTLLFLKCHLLAENEFAFSISPSAVFVQTQLYKPGHTPGAVNCFEF